MNLVKIPSKNGIIRTIQLRLPEKLFLQITLRKKDIFDAILNDVAIQKQD